MLLSVLLVLLRQGNIVALRVGVLLIMSLPVIRIILNFAFTACVFVLHIDAERIEGNGASEVTPPFLRHVLIDVRVLAEEVRKSADPIPHKMHYEVSPREGCRMNDDVALETTDRQQAAEQTKQCHRAVEDIGLVLIACKVDKTCVDVGAKHHTEHCAATEET